MAGVASVVGATSASVPLLTNGLWVAMLAFARRLGTFPPAGRFTFGLGRAVHVVQLVIGIVLVELAGVSVFLAVKRLVHPEDVDAPKVLATALAGALVVAVCAWIVARSPATGSDFTLKVAFGQLRSEVLSYGLAGVAAVLILATDWQRFDPLAGLLVAGLVLRDASEDLQDAGGVLLEGAPAGLDPQRIGHAMAAHAGVIEVRDLHVWEITSGFPALAAHVLVHPRSDVRGVRRSIGAMIAERFGIEHVTLDIDHAPPTDRILEIEPRT